MKFLIAPSILACDLTRLGESLRTVEDAGADWHHLDIMDGHFVPNLTFGPDIVKAVKKAGRLPADVHLMVTNPEHFVTPFAQAGADLLSFHIEVAPDPRPLIRRIRDLGVRPALVIRPKTPASAVIPFLGDVDMVLVMTVEPGFTGQAFMPECVGKIAELRRAAGPNLDIEVDGGLNGETTAQTAAAGANVIVAGAAVYRAPDPRAALGKIRTVLQSHYCDRP